MAPRGMRRPRAAEAGAEAEKALETETTEPLARGALPSLPRAFEAKRSQNSPERAAKEAKSDSDSDSDSDSEDERTNDPFAGVELDRKAPESMRVRQNQDEKKQQDEEADEDEEDLEAPPTERRPDGTLIYPTRLQAQTKPRDIEKQTQKLLTDEEALCAPSGTALQQREKHARKRGEKKDFHDMVTPELTAEVKMDLRALQLRNYMDPSRFYKANDRAKMPTKFQIGTIQEGLGEFKSHRIKKRDRKPTFVDEVLGDTSVRSYTKRVFGGMQKERARTPFSKNKRRKTSGGGGGRGRGRK